MTQHTFENIMKHQLAKCATILHTKRQEYAPDVDVLHNFKSAAGLLGCPPREALAGMNAETHGEPVRHVPGERAQGHRRCGKRR